MFKPTKELEQYMSLVAADFMEETNLDDYMIRVEKNRQRNAKIALLAFFKIYKGIPLSIEEQELLTKYTTGIDYEYLAKYHESSLENQIAYIAYETSREAWDKVNDMRIEKDCYDYTHFDKIPWRMFDDAGNETLDIKRRRYERRVWQSEIYQGYLKEVGEYNYAMLHTYVYGGRVWLGTFKKARPIIDYDTGIFIEVIRPKEKILSLAKKCFKRG